ncbi:MAG: hypothetical protein U0324_47020 [Polyangiales bacterium]
MTIERIGRPPAGALLALTVVAACAGDPPAPPVDAAPDVDLCASAGQPCGCRTGPGVVQGALRCVGGGLVCECAAAPDADPGMDVAADAPGEGPGEVGIDAAAEAAADVASIDAPDVAPDAAADADAACDVRCDSACVDPDFDPLNCGRCGMRCAAAAPNMRALCFAGRCGMACVADYDDCNGNLADGCETFLRGTDRTHCGSCRGVCNSAERCVMGVCRPL